MSSPPVPSRYRFLAVFGALCLFAQPQIAAAQSDPRDFQLQPAPTPTGQGNVQGPVDEGAQIRPRPTPRPQPAATPTPRPTASAPTPTSPETRPAPAARETARPAPRQTVPAPSPRITSLPPAGGAVAAPPPAALPTGPDIADPLGDVSPDAGIAAPAGDAATTPGIPAVTRPAAQPVETGGGFPWWLAVLAALAALIAGGYALWRRQDAKPLPVPEFVPAATVPRPAAPGRPAPTTNQTTPVAPALRGLGVEVEAVKLTRSLMAVTVDYRIRLINRGPATTGPLTLLGDLVSAHGGLPVERQMADAAQALPALSTIGALSAGETHLAEGQIRLPLQEVTPIRQGNAPLFVPLLRLRVEGAPEPVIRTHVIGLRQPGSTRLQPFRLDETPQSYSQIGQRALG